MYGSETSHVITCEGVELVGCVAVGDNVIGKVQDLLVFHPGEGYHLLELSEPHGWVIFVAKEHVSGGGVFCHSGSIRKGGLQGMMDGKGRWAVSC